MLKQLIRPSVLEISPYKPGKPIEEVRREFGSDDIIKMASNENALGPSKLAVDAMREALEGVNLYPDGNAYYLKKKLAKFLNVEERLIVPGNGSDEIIRMVIDAFLNEEEEIILGESSFVIYKIASQIAGRCYREVPLRDYAYDLSAIAEKIDKKTKVIFIANPNNPTGTFLPREAIADFMNKIPENIIVVFDEAYYEYVEESERLPKTLDYIRDGRAVVCLRTFSKIYGLAGIRAGYSISPPEFADAMNRVRGPFNANLLAQIAASAALDDREHVKKSRELVSKGKVYLYKELSKMGISYIPSETNFVLIDVEKEAKEVSNALMKKGIIVREMSGYGLPSFIRVTIGLPRHNERFIRALSEVLKKSL